MRTLRTAALAPLWLLLTCTALLAQDATSLLRSGPMVGYGTHREVAVWLQTTRPADVQLRYWSLTDPSTDNPAIRPDPDTLLTPVHHTTAAGDHIAEFTIAHLEPGNTYRYEVILNGVTIDRPYPLRFQTQQLWQWRTDPPRFTVAVGSCAYINDPPYDRPGEPYGGDYRIFESIAALNPNLMVWLGDNVYYREVDWATPTMMSYRYAHTRQTPEMQALLGSTHNYATWDDHDYGPNNSNRSYRLRGAALDIFKRYWANPNYGRPNVPGVFGKFQWNDVEFFLLDDRYYRSPNDAPTTDEKTMWGEAQLQWLIDALATSDAPFKIVVNGGQLLNPANRYEALSSFPDDQSDLLSAIQQRKIEGVVFLSGDRHHTELMRYTPENFYPLYEFTNSPLTAGAANVNEDNPRRIEGTLVEQRNFGTLTFSGPRTDRTLTIRTYDIDGALLWKRSIKAQDLQLDDE
ncbi:alkaline phosphatase D family protein [Salisaeta longa]|uniref:alkaline phosphatase D family protein n=1 Tax=Salisaeta longa TaxID=503170 RepID=UPI00040DD191|nr:alkaline phosphatase D family protein [Salisaeta longa]